MIPKTDTQSTAEKAREVPIDPEVLCVQALGWWHPPPPMSQDQDGKTVWIRYDKKWESRFGTKCEELVFGTPDFENVLADAWLLVEALPPECFFSLRRLPTPNLNQKFHWEAEIHVQAVFRAFIASALTEAQAITRARWSMYLETGK